MIDLERDEVVDLFDDLATGEPLDLSAVSAHLSRKSDPQYLEYLRLKAIYEVD